MSRSAPYLQRRGYALSFRIAVPPDLQNVIGLREITKSLPTTNKVLAVPMALEFAACAKRMFCELRTAMTVLDDEGKRQPLDMDKLKATVQEAKYRIQIADLKEQSFDKEVERHREHRRELERVKLQTENDTLRRVMAGFTTSPLPTPAPVPPSSPVAPTSGPVPTFHRVIDAYLDEYPKVANPCMFDKHKTVLPMLREFVGDIPIDDFDQKKLVDFFKMVLRLPANWKHQCHAKKLTVRQLAEQEHEITLHPKTINNSYKASVRLFIEYGITNLQAKGFPTTLAVKGIKYNGLRKAGEAKQRPFKPVELKRLFEGPEMQTFANDPAQAHCYWFPHIGLFTGARVNEVCQLNPQTDILKDPVSGIWYFLITEETESGEGVVKSTKNAISMRKVPIHSKLIELGIIQHIQKLKDSGEKLIFPGWKPSRGRAAGGPEKWFRQLIVDTGLKDQTKGARLVGFHAFRHTLENKGVNTKGLPWPIENITGHAIPGKSAVAAGYSGELDLKNKQEVMELINFDLNLIRRETYNTKSN